FCPPYQLCPGDGLSVSERPLQPDLLQRRPHPDRDSRLHCRPSDCDPSNQLRKALRNRECTFAATVLLRSPGSWPSLLPLRCPGYPEDLRPATPDRGVEPLGDR